MPVFGIIGIIVGSIALAIAVTALVFGVLSWTEGHTHGVEGSFGPGLLGIHEYTDDNDLGQQIAFYDPVSGRRTSSYLNPHRSVQEDNPAAWGNGRTPTEIVSLWTYRRLETWYILTRDLNHLENEPTYVPLAKDVPEIEYEDHHHGNGVCWDAARNRWLACMYCEEGKVDRWELVAIDEEGHETLVSSLGTGPSEHEFVDAGDGCQGLCFCGDRLFAVFARDENMLGNQIGIARIVEFDPVTGAILGWHQWNTQEDEEPGIVGAGKVITEHTNPAILNKKMLDAFYGLAYSVSEQRVYFILGHGLRTLGWVALADIPNPLTETTPFDIHIANHLPSDNLDAIVWISETTTPPTDFPVHGFVIGKNENA